MCQDVVITHLTRCSDPGKDFRHQAFCITCLGGRGYQTGTWLMFCSRRLCPCIHHERCTQSLGHYSQGANKEESHFLTPCPFTSHSQAAGRRIKDTSQQGHRDTVCPGTELGPIYHMKLFSKYDDWSIPRGGSRKQSPQQGQV